MLLYVRLCQWVIKGDEWKYILALTSKQRFISFQLQTIIFGDSGIFDTLLKPFTYSLGEISCTTIPVSLFSSISTKISLLIDGRRLRL